VIAKNQAPLSAPCVLAGMSKYRPLSDRLTAHPEDEWRTSFADIEEMLGFPLPKGARSGRAWWDKAAPPGWEVGEVDQDAGTVRFSRAAAATIGNEIQPAAMQQASEKASSLAARHRKLGAAVMAAGIAAVGVGLGMALTKAPSPGFFARPRLKRFNRR
jgi:hypothetical protein